MLVYFVTATVILGGAAIAAVIFLVRARAEVRRVKKRYESIVSVEEERDRISRERDAVINETQGLRDHFAREQAKLTDEITAARKKWETDYGTALNELERLTKEVEVFSTSAELQSFGFYKNHYDFETSAQYKERLEDVLAKQEAMLKNKTAAVCDNTWTIDGSAAKGRQMIERQLKLQLRAFNGEADSAIARVKYNNATAMEERIRRAHTAINKLGQSVHCEITGRYLELKLAELRLSHEYEMKVQAEKEEQREIRERMREEEAALREIERAQKDAEKEEERFEQALQKAQQELAKGSEKEKEKLSAKIMELERKLAEAHAKKEKALSMAQLTKSGHVYVISNVGSFGDNVYKVGMTRRLEPLDRVRELGDASVPFLFDVHALIYSENAPALENQLHVLLDDHRVNLVNDRKEFFQVTLDEIEHAVRRCAGATIEFTRIAEAPEFRQSVVMRADREAARRNSLPPSPAKEVLSDAREGLEKMRAILGAS